MPKIASRIVLPVDPQGYATIGLGVLFRQHHWRFSSTILSGSVHTLCVEFTMLQTLHLSIQMPATLAGTAVREPGAAKVQAQVRNLECPFAVNHSEAILAPIRHPSRFHWDVNHSVHLAHPIARSVRRTLESQEFDMHGPRIPAAPVSMLTERQFHVQ